MNTSIKKMLPWLLFCVIISCVFLLFLSEKAIFQNFIFDSDDLYLPSLFKNIFSHNGSIHDWYLTPAPYFFPDYLLFGISYVLTKKIHYQMAIYACLQITLLWICLYFLFKKMVAAERNLSSTDFLELPRYMAISTTALLLWLATNQSIYSYLLLSANHYGTFLVEVTSTIFILDYFQKVNINAISKKYIVLSVFILSIIITYSDCLYIAQYVAPMSAAYVCSSLTIREKKIKESLVIIAILVGSFIGYKLYPLFLAHPTRYPNHLHLKQYIINFPYISAIFHRMMIGMPFVTLYLSFFYITLVLSIPYLIIQRKKRELLIALFLLFSAGSILSTLIFIRHFIPADRYFISFVNWPIIFGVYFLTIRIKKISYMFNLCILTLILFFLGLEIKGLLETNHFHNQYKNADVVCIDRALNAFPEHKYGIAQYWDAKFIQAHSEHELVLAQYDRLLNEHRWITSSTFFRNVYDFAIINTNSPIDEYKIPRTIITRYSGKPLKTIHCGNHDLLIYNKDKLKTKSISNVGEKAFWRGCELPTRIGTISSQCSIASQNTPVAGYLTYGPYQLLPAGEYRFSIDYKSAGEPNEPVGRIEIAISTNSPPQILSTEPLMNTKNHHNMIDGKFTLPEADHFEKIEIRTYIDKNQSVKLYRLELERIF